MFRVFRGRVEEAVWAATEGQGVVRYKSGVFSTHAESDGLPQVAGRPDTRIRSLLLEAGHLVVDTPNGMFRWDGGRVVRQRVRDPPATIRVALVKFAAAHRSELS